MARTERTKWGMCFGIIAAMLVGGVLLMGAARPGSSQAAERDHANRASQASAPATGAARTGDAGAARAGDAGAGGTRMTGAQLFARTCNRCHPNGAEDVGPSLVNKNFAPDRMTKQIRQGSGRMRAITVARLADADLPALLAYLRTQYHAVR